MTHVLKISPADFEDLRRKKIKYPDVWLSEKKFCRHLRCLREKIFTTYEHKFSQMIIGNSEKFLTQ